MNVQLCVFFISSQIDYIMFSLKQDFLYNTVTAHPCTCPPKLAENSTPCLFTASAMIASNLTSQHSRRDRRALESNHSGNEWSVWK